jgi:hypothetical protein
MTSGMGCPFNTVIERCGKAGNRRTDAVYLRSRGSAADCYWIAPSMTSGHHEHGTHQQQVKGGSERSFGLVFAVVLALVGLWPLWHGQAPRWWALPAAAVFLGLALAAPRALRPLNRVWIRFGLLLNRIVSPIVLGLMFYGIITPLGYALRRTAWDPLHLQWESKAASYWIERRPPGPEPQTMIHQF